MPAPVDPNTLSLLSLPAEIRNNINEQLFKVTEPIKVLSLYGDDDGPSLLLPGIFQGTQLLAACHYIYKEANPIMYAQNTSVFEAHDLTTGDVMNRRVSHWLHVIGRNVPFTRCIHADITNIKLNRNAPDIELDVLPVLRHLWQHNNVKIGVFPTRLCKPNSHRMSQKQLSHSS
jgi:hypothetical protein